MGTVFWIIWVGLSNHKGLFKEKKETQGSGLEKGM